MKPPRTEDEILADSMVRHIVAALVKGVLIAAVVGIVAVSIGWVVANTSRWIALSAILAILIAIFVIWAFVFTDDMTVDIPAHPGKTFETGWKPLPAFSRAVLACAAFAACAGGLAMSICLQEAILAAVLSILTLVLFVVAGVAVVEAIRRR